MVVFLLECVLILVYYWFVVVWFDLMMVCIDMFCNQLQVIDVNGYCIVLFVDVVCWYDGQCDVVLVWVVVIMVDDGYCLVYEVLCLLLVVYLVLVMLFIYLLVIFNVSYVMMWDQLFVFGWVGFDIEFYMVWYLNFCVECVWFVLDDYQCFVLFQLSWLCVWFEVEIGCLVWLLVWLFGVYDVLIDQLVVCEGYVVVFMFDVCFVCIIDLVMVLLCYLMIDVCDI